MEVKLNEGLWIDRFIKIVEEIGPEVQNATTKRLRLVAHSLARIDASEDEYREIFGPRWPNVIRNLKEKAKPFISGKHDSAENVSIDLVISIGRVVMEKFLKSGLYENSVELPLLRYMSGDGDELSERERDQKNLWLPLLQQGVIREQAHELHNRVSEMMGKIDDSNNEALKQLKFFKDELEQAEGRLKVYKEEARSLTAEFNFVRLAGAFRKLIRDKRIELRGVAGRLKLMGWIVVSPLILSIIATAVIWALSSDPTATLKDKLIYSLPMLVPLEAILVYYFRIFLKEQLSLKAQILQLELRYSVCAFIEGYIDFAKGIEKEKLEKFEALVFSGLVPDPTAVPSTFDGMDQLINLAKAARG